MSIEVLHVTSDRYKLFIDSLQVSTVYFRVELNSKINKTIIFNYRGLILVVIVLSSPRNVNDYLLSIQNDLKIGSYVRITGLRLFLSLSIDKCR